ncbi:YncE family protein [Rhodanobacter sp. B2A1Ga4]|uniref:YncE family protein n=1 Tax=Rhodanobacter sp. B2A1Ga4 TaxID=2778647 RepID=UPI001B372285|nr:YncE family protein [Rhodanobacter sp. B2A1Ga4]MBQ4856078.1 YncE family protein [Rhodanobacter sp. B2A1Ga4]
MARPIRKLLPAALLALAVLPSIAAAATPPAPHLLSRLALGGPGGWDYLAFDAPSRHLFVSRGDRVLVVDVDSGKQIGTIPDTAGVHGIALADDLQRGFVSDGRSASVTVFDLASLKTVATITGTGQNPDAILYDGASHHVLTFNGRSASASVIDPAKNAVVGSIALPGKPEFAVADGAGHVYVNIEDKSELVQLDSIHDKLLQTWPLAPCESPSGLALDNPHHRLFAVCDNRTMTVLDALDGHHVADVAIDDGPDAVVFDAAEAMIYSSNGQSGTITAVHEDDPDHYRVTATVATQASARTLALDPKLHRLYLSAARLGATRQANGRRTVEPDSFTVLTVGRP